MMEKFTLKVLKYHTLIMPHRKQKSNIATIGTKFDTSYFVEKIRLTFNYKHFNLLNYVAKKEES